MRLRHAGLRTAGWPAAVLLASLFAAVSRGADAPAWPLPLPERFLTSDFMEYRPGRFHAGIDLKTRERPGFPVRACEDGWVARVRTGAGGYGRALYLATPGGRTYVYAHLSRLADRWRSALRRAQAAAGRYAVDLSFPPGRFPVRRGEVLALSGQSGTAGPHLHFEVRGPGQRPRDPLAWGFAVPDTFPPRITRIRAIPASPRTRLAGGTTAVAVGDGRTPLPAALPPLAVRGPVAFTAAVVDQSDIKGHRLEPWRLRVTLDDSLVFAACNDSFAFARQDRMRLEWLVDGKRRERWLWRRPGDDLPGRFGGDWSLDPGVLTPGRHRVRVEATDRAGNRAVTAWELRVGDPAPDSTAAGGWRPDPVTVTVPGGGRGAWRLNPFFVCHGDSCGPPLQQPGWLAPAPVLVRPDRLDRAERRRLAREQGLRPVGVAVRVWCPDWTARDGLAVGPFTLPDADGAALGAYRRDDQGRWRWVDRPRNRDGGWWFTAGGPGRYALLEDGRPPRWGDGPSAGLVGAGPDTVDPAVSPPRWAVVAVSLEDAGAGVDADSLSARWDGRPLVVEPDLPRRRVLVEIPDTTRAGPHVLELRAVDRAGNAATRRYRWRLAR